MNEIVVGVDQSETAKRAAVTAAGLAAAHGTTLHMVTCAEPKASVEVGIGSDHFTSDWESDARLYLNNLAGELPHDQISVAVATGDPATALCDEAKRLDAHMIVVGNRRVQGVSRVLGSVASHVLKKSPCDVYIAHTRS